MRAVGILAGARRSLVCCMQVAGISRGFVRIVQLTTGCRGAGCLGGTGVVPLLISAVGELRGERHGIERLEASEATIRRRRFDD